jgi:hypothetical protein
MNLTLISRVYFLGLSIAMTLVTGILMAVTW